MQEEPFPEANRIKKDETNYIYRNFSRAASEMPEWKTALTVGHRILLKQAKKNFNRTHCPFKYHILSDDGWNEASIFTTKTRIFFII